MSLRSIKVMFGVLALLLVANNGYFLNVAFAKGLSAESLMIDDTFLGGGSRSKVRSLTDAPTFGPYVMTVDSWNNYVGNLKESCGNEGLVTDPNSETIKIWRKLKNEEICDLNFRTTKQDCWYNVSRKQSYTCASKAANTISREFQSPDDDDCGHANKFGSTFKANACKKGVKALKAQAERNQAMNIGSQVVAQGLALATSNQRIENQNDAIDAQRRNLQTSALTTLAAGASSLYNSFQARKIRDRAKRAKSKLGKARKGYDRALTNALNSVGDNDARKQYKKYVAEQNKLTAIEENVSAQQKAVNNTSSGTAFSKSRQRVAGVKKIHDNFANQMQGSKVKDVVGSEKFQSFDSFRRDSREAEGELDAVADEADNQQNASLISGIGNMMASAQAFMQARRLKKIENNLASLPPPPKTPFALESLSQQKQDAPVTTSGAATDDGFVAGNTEDAGLFSGERGSVTNGLRNGARFGKKQFAARKARSSGPGGGGGLGGGGGGGGGEGGGNSAPQLGPVDAARYGNSGGSAGVPITEGGADLGEDSGIGEAIKDMLANQADGSNVTNIAGLDPDEIQRRGLASNSDAQENIDTEDSRDIFNMVRSKIDTIEMSGNI